MGVMGFALGSAMGGRTASSPVASVVASAIPSFVVDATPSTPASHGASPPPSLGPISTPLPRWAWTRTELLAGDPLNVLGIWSVGNQILVLGDESTNGGAPDWTVAVLEPGRAWRQWSAPGAIERITGASVVGDRLWFFARVNGLVTGDIPWRLVGTGDGESWEALEPATGLEEVDTVQFVGRSGDTWVAAIWPFETDTGVQPRLIYSEDGVGWTDAVVPALGGVLSFDRIAALGDTLIVTATAGTEPETHQAILTSTDGITWEQATLPATLDLPYALACSSTLCILTGFEYDAPSMPVAWRSSDGRTWLESMTSMSGFDHSGIVYLVSTRDGFLGIEEYPRVAWLSSPDGITWQSFDVMPFDSPDQLIGIGAAGDTTVLLAGAPEGGAVTWRGNLSSLVR